MSTLQKNDKRISLPNLSHCKNLVLDVETDGLSWKTNKVVGYVVTVGPKQEESWYFPTRHKQGGNFDHDQITEWLKMEVMERDDIRLIGHNFKFDLHFLANEGLFFKTKHLECTMVNAAILNENAGKYSLDDCAKRMGVETKKGDVMYQHLATLFGGEANKKQMGNFWMTSGVDPIVNEYARGDGVSTWQLWEEQQKAIGGQELWKVHSLECRVLRTLFRMERHGVRIDVKKMKALQKELESENKGLLKKFKKDFNPRSPKDMKELMLQYHQTDWPMTQPSKKFPMGQPSFKEEWLKTHDIGRTVLKSRKLAHMLSSFVNPLLDKHVFKGRVHTTFNQLKMDDFGVVSGRLSSSFPNLTAIPKRDKVLAPRLRDCFLPDKGCEWSSNDYSQQEFVVFAHFGKVRFLIDGYNQNPPIDAHSMVALKMNVERDPTGKRMNLAQVYGQGVPALAHELGISEAEAQKLSNEYHRIFPEAKELYNKAQTTAKRRGYVKTLMGRRRRYPDSRQAWTAMNQLIQGSSADITKLKMVEVDEFFEENGDKTRLQLQIHDDLNWSNHKTKKGREEKAEAISIMTRFGPEDTINLSLPLRVDSASGGSWGKATFLNYEWDK